MSDLKHLNLTEKDFDLLVEGLDAIPNKGAAGELMGDLLGAMLTKGDEAAQAKLESDKDRRRREKELKEALLKEDIKILQGKLLMLKRYLMQEGALSATYEIINHI